MDFTLMHSLLLLTTCVALSMAAAVGGESNDVITTENTLPDKNGGEVSQTTEVDAGCKVLTSYADYGNDSSSTAINDYKYGLSLVTFSDQDDVCYVRNLSATEKRQAASCRYGSMKVASGKEAPKGEEKHFESSESEVISIDKLSPTLQEQCQGKEIRLLKETTDTPSDKNEVRTKRGCYYWITYYYYYCNCYTKCYPCNVYCYICSYYVITLYC